MDPVQDAPFCSAAVSQIKQFGGSTTISKLRGFLRNRLSASDNIKSVPLKSMLNAYPHIFVVSGSQVSLATVSPNLTPHSHQCIENGEGEIRHQDVSICPQKGFHQKSLFEYHSVGLSSPTTPDFSSRVANS